MILTGESSGDVFGLSSSFAMDVNSDGFADVVIGAPYNDIGGTDAGRAYVFLGDSVLPSTRSADSADIIFTGLTVNGWFGSIVSGVGDFNCDGTTDILISATPTLSSDSGKAYLFYGPFSVAITSSSADTIFTGEAAGDGFGGSSAGAGDVNGDRCKDIIIGAPGNDVEGGGAGRAYVFMDCSQDIIPEDTILSVSPDTLFFSAPEGGANPVPDSFSVIENGGVNIAYTLVESSPWLSLNKSAGTTPDTIAVSTNISGLVAGTYFDSITVSSTEATNSPQYVYVSLQVEQSNPDAGAPDSVKLVLAVPPVIGSNVPVVVECSVFVDLDTLSVLEFGWYWDNPNLQMDSAKAWGDFAAMEIGPFFYLPPSRH